MKKIFVLVNPTSGKKKAMLVYGQLKKYLEQTDTGFEVFFTSPEHNGWKTLEQNLNKTFTDLIVIGGDGTLNEAVNGLNQDIPLGILPAGSGNDYVKMLDLGQSLQEQIQTAVNGQIRPVDLGVCNGRKFLNGVGIGFDGQIVADMARKKTWVQGAAKYYYHVLKILSSYQAKKFDYSIDGNKKQKELILLCIAKGSTFGGSFKLTPNATLDSGVLHVCEIGDLQPIKRFLNIRKLETGAHDQLREVRLFDARHMLIEENPLLHAHIDGECFGNPPFELRVMKNALKVRVSG